MATSIIGLLILLRHEEFLDTDLYKLTMGQFVWKKYPDLNVKYKFVDRGANKESLYPDEFFKMLNDELDRISDLSLTLDEKFFLEDLGYFDSAYLNKLQKSKPLKREYIRAYRGENGLLEIDIEGPWRNTIFFEVPVLAIISELKTKFRYSSVYADGTVDFYDFRPSLNEHVTKLNQQVEQMRQIDWRGPVYEFGTRRRSCYEFHERVVEEFAAQKQLYPSFPIGGTSNLHLAKIFELKPIGSVAHEYFQAFQAICPSLENFQKQALKEWADFYKDFMPLIALTDTVGVDAFLNDFDDTQDLYAGVRHDSSCPFQWTSKMLSYYEQNGVDPKSRMFLYSDGLDLDRCKSLEGKFGHRTNVHFAIGTNFTNHLNRPPKIVIKMVECDGKPVAKISDEPGKEICPDKEFLNKLKKTFNK